MDSEIALLASNGKVLNATKERAVICKVVYDIKEFDTMYMINLIWSNLVSI
jgi:hypothetical protein